MIAFACVSVMGMGWSCWCWQSRFLDQIKLPKISSNDSCNHSCAFSFVVIVPGTTRATHTVTSSTPF